ncbi:beta-phosphoglucomutase [Nitriliruptor alkaliphilus]|uniref:beta-phosphoglucomutase n=1 Tax=Nitriliruptor alkaliphilus TaxID=427918 RepID=UPI0009F9B0FF|nr:beta-phosphoglucomutase [Nitriliruptor alkaliphilus]
MPDVPIRAVIFDLDGVLTDTAEFHYRAWQELADAEGLPFDRQANEALRGVSRADSLRLVLAGREVDEATFARMMAEKNERYVELLADMSPDDLLPGALELVEACRDRGLKLAIGSSSKNAPMVLDALEITDRFDAIADGSTVEVAKPAPDLFLAAARSLDVEPATCAVVEDAEAGVDAALAAGMLAVGIGPAERVGHAHLRYPSTADVDLETILARGA